MLGDLKRSQAILGDLGRCPLGPGVRLIFNTFISNNKTKKKEHCDHAL